MVEDNSIAEFLKVILSPKYLFGIWFIGFIILFAPESITDKFGLTEFIKSFRGWIGIISLISFSIWVSVLGVYFWNSLKERNLNNKYSKESKLETLEQIRHLSQEEIFYLWMCIDKNQQTFVGYFFNPHITALVSKGLLLHPSLTDAWNCPFTIPSFVWDYLLKNKKSFLPKNIDDLRSAYQTYENLPDWRRKNFP